MLDTCNRRPVVVPPPDLEEPLQSRTHPRWMVDSDTLCLAELSRMLAVSSVTEFQRSEELNRHKILLRNLQKESDAHRRTIAELRCDNDRLRTAVDQRTAEVEAFNVQAIELLAAIRHLKSKLRKARR